MIDKFIETMMNADPCIAISISEKFADGLYAHDTRPFDFVKSTFAGVPCMIREHQAAPYLITIQGGKK